MKENHSRMAVGFAIAAVIAGPLCLGAVLSSASPVRAQARPAASATPGMSGGIPAQAPPSWHQKDWDLLRAQCSELFSKAAARAHMTPEQLRNVPPFTEKEHEEFESCLSALPRPWSSRPAPPTGSVTPTPLPTPSASGSSPGVLRPRSEAPSDLVAPGASVSLRPDEVLSPSASLSLAPGCTSSDATLGPFQTCPGASVSACTLQPPDVAGEVSPNQGNQAGQAVELLNSGLYVYDKSGNLLGAPETLSQFWCGTPGNNDQYLTGCASNPPAALTDTQVAFHPTAQRWIATTLAYSPSTQQGVAVYFASSNSPSALDTAGNWNRWSFSANCSSAPLWDQPILGYNEDWIAVDTLCFTLPPSQEVDDSLSLIPYSDIENPPSSITSRAPRCSWPVTTRRSSRAKRWWWTEG